MKYIRHFFLCFVSLHSSLASAAASESVAKKALDDPLAQGYLWRLAGGLLIILLLLGIAAWGAKRMWGLQTKGSANLRLLGGLAVGQRERVVLVQVEGERLLLGVAPGRVEKIHQLQAAEPAPETPRNAPPDELTNNESNLTDSFASRLAKVIGRRAAS